MEECFAGLLFVDINEASHFLKRVQKRERYANRKTLLNKNAVALTKKVREEQKSQVVHGPRGESLIDNQRKRYNYEDVDTIPTTKHKAPPLLRQRPKHLIQTKQVHFPISIRQQHPHRLPQPLLFLLHLLK